MVQFNRALIIDVETGGFSTTNDAIVEIGILEVDENFEITDSLQTYIIPEEGKEVSDGAANINGYSDELWGKFADDHEPTEEELENVVEPLADLETVRGQVRQWLEGKKIDIVIAHNSPFDKRWFEAKFPTSAEDLGVWVCTMKGLKEHLKAQNIKPGKGDATLEAGCERYKYAEVTGEEWGRHSALDDCYATRFVAEQLQKLGYLG